MHTEFILGTNFSATTMVTAFPTYTTDLHEYDKTSKSIPIV